MDKRFRPFGGLAQRTVGFVNEDKTRRGPGVTPSSRSLAGKAGEALFERVPGGVKPRVRRHRNQAPAGLRRQDHARHQPAGRGRKRARTSRWWPTTPSTAA
ncbi:MAG: hypothetical protein WKG07_22215 [Hymenobacter sp.]